MWGDGMFHPEALLFAQMYEEETKPVVIWNPVDKKMQIIDKDQIQSRITKTKANLMKFMMAKNCRDFGLSKIRSILPKFSKNAKRKN